MANYYTKWAKGTTAETWDQPDKAKVRHMHNRGKSIDFIHRYTGMPVPVIESVLRNTNADGTWRGCDNDRLPSTDNVLNTADPIAPNPAAVKRERLALSIANKRFVERLKAVA